MSANSDYTIFPENRLILARLKGPVSHQDLVSLTEKVCNDDLYDKSYDGIIDVRHASIDMGTSGVEAFAQLILASESVNEGRVAVISSKPVETALSYFLSKRLEKKGTISVFSTWKGVAAFLGLSESMLTDIEDEGVYDAMYN